MKQEKGVIIAAYKQSRRSKRYAVLQRQKDWEGWELPKGRLEDEEPVEAAKRELKEETGIKEDEIQKIEELDKKISWEYNENGEEIRKEYQGFAAEIKEDASIDTSANPDGEHSNGFFLKPEDAKSLLTYENNAEVLEAAEEQGEQE